VYFAHLSIEEFFMMASTIASSSGHSGEHVPWIFFGAGLVAGGIAVGGIVTDPWHARRDCQPRYEFCGDTDKMWLPDEPGNKDPSNPPRNLKPLTITSSSTSTTVSTHTPAGALTITLL
jgi:hypothetical protein